MGGRLAQALRASWLPKITNGWFFSAESFFSVARYLDKAALESSGVPPAARVSLPFARRGISSFFQGALQAPGHLNLRQAGIRAVAVTAGRVPEA
jgi:predicted ATPase